MKYKVQPTSVERVMREDDFIVSKTDLKGRITYGNRIFMEFSGFSEAELLNAPHNIIRHPDMPRGVFKLLWDTLADRQEVFAYVKNMAKDGSFYWVFANVTPSFDANGIVTGYLSVRRKPKASGVSVCEGLYRAMLDAEQKAGPRDACEASMALLQSVLRDKGMSYGELVLAL
ncbi:MULTISPECIES: PAS domain-containing protein [Niveibacterium]|uniref:PAS domain-containing protein n=1 Tax=Niveibacterium microcysteis TaxID=2811415 RepID=A0ABX7M8H5_9RHOO|nr:MULTISPECIES: PAS domain-containing protein [Niveibacterium]QSI78036.1 PAS domain-containing protein [Niveibacterium microcysteis]